MTKTVDDLIATAQPRTEKVQVCARGDLVDRHAELVAELGVAVDDPSARSLGEGLTPEVERIHDEIQQVEAEMEEATVTFALRAIGSLAWQNLLRAHLPRPGRDHRLMFNLATFPPAAVAACAVDPPVTVEQAQQMYGTDEEPGVLHSAEWDKLWSAAYVLNETATPHPKLPAAIESLLKNGRSSTTAANEASPDPSSSDDSDAR